MASVPVTLALLVFQSAAGTLNVADLARATARRTDSGSGAMLDLDNTPSLRLGLDWPATAVALDYAPRFYWLDVLGPGPSPTLLLHSAGLSAEWRWPRYVLRLEQTVTYGDQDFTYGAPGLTVAPGATDAPPGTDPAMPADLDLLPRADVVRIADEETSASLRHDWTRRWSSTVEASFGISGGADAEAQVFLPQLRTTRLQTSLDYRRSLRDELGTDLILAHVDTSNDFDHRVVSLMETWSMRWTRNTGGELGAGAALQDTTDPAGLESTEWEPVGTASAYYEWLARAARMRLQLDVGYRPDVDVVTGALQSRVFTTAQAGVLVDGSSVLLVLGAAQTIPRDAPDATELISADLVFEQELLEWLDLQLGGQILRQRLSSASTLAASGTRWLLYAGLEAETPVMRF
jgi:hypothetical protein